MNGSFRKKENLQNSQIFFPPKLNHMPHIFPVHLQGCNLQRFLNFQTENFNLYDI